MKKLFIPIIFARANEHRVSYTEKLVPVVLAATRSRDIKTAVIDTRTAGIHETSREIHSATKKKLSRVLASADGFILVSPEYNHGYPGELKIFLDSFYDEFNRKPTGIIGISNGGIGGARMVEQLRLVAIALQMVPINGVIHFSTAQKLFDERGKFKTESEKLYTARFEKFFSELMWYAEALKAVRKKKRK